MGNPFESKKPKIKIPEKEEEPSVEDAVSQLAGAGVSSTISAAAREDPRAGLADAVKKRRQLGLVA